MHLDRRKVKDEFTSESDNSDESDDNSDMSDFSDDSDDSDVSDSESDNETNVQNVNANDNQGSSSGANDEESVLNEEEEDEVVKAIIKSKEIERNHPPTITVEDFVVDISFHPVRDIIAVANIMGDVLLYKYNNMETELLTTLELHLKACRDIEFSSDGQTLFSTAKDLTIMLTDVETEKLARLYENTHERPIYTLNVISEHTFATGDDDGVVKLWDLRQKGEKPVFALKEMEDYVSSMLTNHDAKYLVCTSGDGSLTTLNIPERRLHVQSEQYDEELTCLGLFKSETKILSASSKGKMYIYNWGEFGLHSDEFPTLTKKAINCMIPITENIVITGGEDGMLRATSLFPHRQLGIVGQHNFSVETLDVSNNGTLIASCSHDNDIKFWNVQYFETLNVMEPRKGQKRKQMAYNLPSSKVSNVSDFFADL